MDAATAERMAGAYAFFLDGIERALGASPFVAGEELTIADIGIVCDVAQFLRERLMQARLARNGFSPISAGLESDYPAFTAHLRALAARPVFSDYLAKTIEQTLPAKAA